MDKDKIDELKEKRQEKMTARKSSCKPCRECQRLNDIANEASREYSVNAAARNKVCGNTGELAPTCIALTKRCNELSRAARAAHEAWQRHYNSPH